MNRPFITTRKGVTKEGKFIIPCEEFIDIEPAMVDGNYSDEIFIGTFDTEEKTYLKINEDGSYSKMLDVFTVFSSFKNGASVVGTYNERFGYKYGLVNDNLSLKLDCVYDAVVEIAKNLYKIKKNGLQGIYDISKDKILFEPKFHDIKYDKENNLFSIIY